MLGSIKIIALVLLCSVSGDETWMRYWIESKNGEAEAKDRKYDFMTTKDFVRNSSDKYSSVFSPICSEMNVLMQACSGEYGEDVIEQSVAHLREITGSVDKLDGNKFKLLNRGYLPVDGRLGFPVESDNLFETYAPDDEAKCAELLEKHNKWIDEGSNGKLQSSWNVQNFLKKMRMYVSLTYFKDEWEENFDTEWTSSGKFYLNKEETTNRDFMKITKKLIHYSHKTGPFSKHGFDLVALPYKDKGGDGFRRCMIYLIPTKKDASLNGIWKEFSKLADYDINGLLLKCSQDMDVALKVPKVKDLKTSHDLTKLLRSTYGRGPAEIVESTMMAYINIDEEGTEAAAIVETCCTDGICIRQECVDITADRPYIAIVYDRILGRILFAMKDTGRVEGA